MSRHLVSYHDTILQWYVVQPWLNDDTQATSHELTNFMPVFFLTVHCVSVDLMHGCTLVNLEGILVLSYMDHFSVMLLGSVLCIIQWYWWCYSNDKIFVHPFIIIRITDQNTNCASCLKTVFLTQPVVSLVRLTCWFCISDWLLTRVLFNKLKLL